MRHGPGPPRRGWARILLAACMLAPGAPAAVPSSYGPDLTPEQVVSLLADMHPDYHLYIATVRYGSSRLRPAGFYAGLVRRGGLDPADPEDGPQAGRGALNDLIVYADTFESWRTPAWRRLVADHEYFHARHIARGFPIPVVGFGQRKADTDYYEALAWGYVLQRADAGAYGDLSARERAEATARYRDHYAGFRRFVMERQPSAWDHYGRYLAAPLPEIMPAVSAPKEATGPVAGQATR